MALSPAPMTPARQRTRMKDIADALNLAVITVSKALRDHSDISRDTKERVWRKARELNYTPNLAARSLVTQRSYVIGLVVPDLLISFFAEVASAIASTLRAEGYEVFLSNAQEDPRIEEKEIERLLGRNVDGIIIASSVPEKHSEYLRPLLSARIPVVLIDRTVSGVRASFVGSDNRRIGELATSHLVEIGCRRIAHLRGPSTSTGNGRMRGYERVLQGSGSHTPVVEYGGSSDEDGLTGMKRLLAMKPRPDGVFCYNDLVAAGALRACIEGQIRVPDDLAIVGCGNHRLSNLLIVPLTTIDQKSREIGHRAARLLLQQLQKGEMAAKKQIVRPELIVRASSLRTLRRSVSHSAHPA